MSSAQLQGHPPPDGGKGRCSKPVERPLDGKSSVKCLRVMGSSKIIIQNLKGTIYFFTASPYPMKIIADPRMEIVRSLSGELLELFRSELKIES